MASNEIKLAFKKEKMPEKPDLTKTETIEHLMFISDQRTQILIEAIQTGSAKSIRIDDYAGK